MGMDHADLAGPSQLTSFLLEQAITNNLLEELNLIELVQGKIQFILSIMRI